MILYGLMRLGTQDKSLTPVRNILVKRFAKVPPFLKSKSQFDLASGLLLYLGKMDSRLKGIRPQFSKDLWKPTKKGSKGVSSGQLVDPLYHP